MCGRRLFWPPFLNLASVKFAETLALAATKSWVTILTPFLISNIELPRIDAIVKGIPLSKEVSMMRHPRDIPAEKAKEYPESLALNPLMSENSPGLLAI